MSEITLSKENFEKEVLNSEKLTLVDFWATWCGPCQMLSPIISEIADEFENTLKVGKINIDDENDLASKYQISSIPTLILFKDGKIVDTVVGYHTKEDLIKRFKL